MLIFWGCNLPTDQATTNISSKVTAAYNLKYKEALDSIESAKKWIQNGDLICRTGFDFVSQSIQNFNSTDKTYSHSGLAF